MNKNEVEKRQDLCEKLNMNFEEANELFGTETLMSIQMAQVNGGTPIKGLYPAIEAIVKGIEIVSALISIWNAFDSQKDGGTPDPRVETVDYEDGSIKFSVPSGYSVKVTETTVTVGDTIYRKEIIMAAPTPKP